MVINNTSFTSQRFQATISHKHNSPEVPNFAPISARPSSSVAHHARASAAHRRYMLLRVRCCAAAHCQRKQRRRQRWRPARLSRDGAVAALVMPDVLLSRLQQWISAPTPRDQRPHWVGVGLGDGSGWRWRWRWSWQWRWRGDDVHDGIGVAGGDSNGGSADDARSPAPHAAAAMVKHAGKVRKQGTNRASRALGSRT